MGSSSKNPPQDGQRRGPNTLLALRDSLIGELRIHKSAGHGDEQGFSGTDEAVGLEKLVHSGMTATEPPIDDDSAALNPTEGRSRHEASVDPEQNVTESRCSGRKVFRKVSGPFIIVMVASVFAMLSLGQGRNFSLGWLSSIFQVATRSSPDSQNQAAPRASDLAVVRRELDELAGKQDQIARDSATQQDQLVKTISTFDLVRRQVEQFGLRQGETTRDLTSGQNQLKAAVSEFAATRRQVEELGPKNDQIAASVSKLQDQLRTSLNDVAVVRRQMEQLATKQEQLADGVAARQDQLKSMVSDFAIVRGQLQELAAKPDQAAAKLMTPADQLATMVSDLAAVRRMAEELTVKQTQMAADIANLQTVERNLGQKIETLSQGRTSRVRRHRKVVGH